MIATPPAVLIDCDPGIDDCLALMYLAGLHHAGEIELVGVTTTAGNVEAYQTAANARWILDLCSLADVPVAPGLPRPLKVDLTTTPETHGPTGLGYATAPATKSHHHDWQRLWKEALAAHHDLQLIVTGPVTDLAAFEKTHGEEAAQFGAITIMGGAVNYRGNTTPTAEWNFWVDPHAAAQHFHSSAPRVPTTLCSLELTEQFLITPQRLEAVMELLHGHPMAQILPDVVRYYFEFHQAQGEGYQAQIHDLLTCMIALEQIDFEVVETTVDVEAESPLLRGTSVADLRNHWGRANNARLVTSADMEAAHQECLRGFTLLASR